VITARIVEDRGGLVGALMVRPEDEIFAITSAGGVIRTRASDVRQSGRQTMGVRLMNLAPGVSVVALARNAESEDESAESVEDLPESVDELDEAVDSEAESEDEGNDLGE